MEAPIDKSLLFDQESSNVNDIREMLFSFY